LLAKILIIEKITCSNSQFNPPKYIKNQFSKLIKHLFLKIKTKNRFKTLINKK